MKVIVNCVDGLTTLRTEVGVRLDGITKIDIRLRPLEFPKATATFLLGSSEFPVDMRVPLEHLHELAKEHGMALVPLIESSEYSGAA